MKFQLREYPEIREQVATMSVDELLCTVVCPHLNTTDENTPRSTASAFFFPATKENCLKKAQALNGGRTAPALIVSDMEYGAASVVTGATQFPSMQAAAIAGDEALAYEMGAIAAKEARAAGFHWTFGPCVDILFNHNNPIVSYRCAGDTAKDNIRFGGAYMRGLLDNGLLVTPKHFPGDGCDENDQHLTVAVNPLSMDKWWDSYGRVYRSMIENGAPAIMAGHISLPAYDDFDETLGVYPPCTLSKKLMTGLLRQELGFSGILISDAATMGGFVGCMNLYCACAAFLERGGDCVLFVQPDDEYLTEMKKCIANGALSIETLRDRSYRMLSFAQQYFEDFSFAALQAPDQPDKDHAMHIAQRIVEGACVIARDRAKQLPLTLDTSARILHLIITSTEYPKDAPSAMTAALRKRFPNVEERTDPGPWELKDLVKTGAYDQIICTVGAQLSFGTNTCKLTGAVARNMMEGWMRYGTPVVFVNFGHPYFGDDYTASVDTLINTYGYTDITPDAVMHRLFD